MTDPAAPMGEARILIFADTATILVRDRYDRLTSEPCRPGSFGVAAIDRMFPAHHPNDYAGNPIRGHDCIDRNMGQRAGRHSCVKRLIGILHDRRAAVSLDRRQARCAVVASPRQHDANHAATCRRSGASEQDIHRRPVAVLTRTYGQLGATVRDLQMTIRRRDDDLAGTQGGPVGRGAARQRAQTVQYSRERARASGRQMEHHAYRGPEIGRQSADNPPECLNASSGGADHDEAGFARSGDLSCGHVLSLRATGDDRARLREVIVSQTAERRRTSSNCGGLAAPTAVVSAAPHPPAFHVLREGAWATGASPGRWLPRLWTSSSTCKPAAPQACSFRTRSATSVPRRAHARPARAGGLVQRLGRAWNRVVAGVLGLKQNGRVLQRSGLGMTLSGCQVGTCRLRCFGDLRQPQRLGHRVQGPSFPFFGMPLAFQRHTSDRGFALTSLKGHVASSSLDWAWLLTLACVYELIWAAGHRRSVADQYEGQDSARQHTSDGQKRGSATTGSKSHIVWASTLEHR